MFKYNSFVIPHCKTISDSRAMESCCDSFWAANQRIESINPILIKAFYVSFYLMVPIEQTLKCNMGISDSFRSILTYIMLYDVILQ